MLENLKERIEKHKSLWLYITLFVFVLFFYNGSLIIKIIMGSPLKYKTTLTGTLTTRLKGSILTILFIVIILYLGKEKISSLGFKSEGLLNKLIIGTAFGLLFFFFKMWIFDKCFIDTMRLPIFLERISNYLILVKSPLQVQHSHFLKESYYLWLVILIVGGLTDEIRRVFFITRFERLQGQWGIIVALFFDFILYGIGGAWQGGLMSALKVGVGGLIFALIYLRKRNITEAMLTHIIADSVALYWTFYLPHRILVFC